MVPIEVLFGIIVVIFILVGFARGFLKELGVTAMIIWTLFVLSLLGPLFERLVGAGNELSDRQSVALCLGYLLLIVVAAVISYQGETLAYGGVPPRGLKGMVLGLMMGLVNGYLIAGSVWHYMARFNYPLSFLGFTSQGLSPAAGMLQPYLAPALLGQPVLLGQSLLLYLSILLIVARVIR
ncbi:MAG: hypothetical protein ACYC6L_07450 [Anaerolineae bacterium]